MVPIILTIIDLREEHELKKTHLESTSNEIQILNIPTRHIQFNLPYIKHLAKVGKVGLMCRSGSRSSAIKQKFFKSNKSVVSINTGISKIKDHKLFDEGKMKIVKNISNFHFGIQQYMQIMFLVILLVSTLLKNKKISVYFNLLIMAFIVFQLVTKSCILSKILSKFD